MGQEVGGRGFESRQALGFFFLSILVAPKEPLGEVEHFPKNGCLVVTRGKSSLISTVCFFKFQPLKIAKSLPENKAFYGLLNMSYSNRSLNNVEKLTFIYIAYATLLRHSWAFASFISSFLSWRRWLRASAHSANLLWSGDLASYF